MKRILLPACLSLIAWSAAALELKSPDIDGGVIDDAFAFDRWGCQGENMSPELTWRDAPEGTQSFALLVHDPDAPTGGAGFWHWIVLDIPGETRSLPRGAGAPERARVIANDYGEQAWGGPCPPEGDSPHRYNVTLYALPAKTLEGVEGASKAVIGFMVNAKALAKASLQGVYGR